MGLMYFFNTKCDNTRALKLLFCLLNKSYPVATNYRFDNDSLTLCAARAPKFVPPLPTVHLVLQNNKHIFMKNFILHQAKTGLLLLFFGLLAQSGWGQTPNGTLDFGITTNGTTATTANTGFGGVRVGTGGGGFTIQNPGQSIGTDGELKGIAPTAASINSVGITSTEYGTAATTFTISFELQLSGGSSGTWSFFAGNGATFASAQSTTFTGNQVFTGIQWIFGASNTITTNNRAVGAWSTISGTPFAQSTSYYVTIIGNNSSSTVNYGASNAYSVAAYTYDLWVNGSLAGNDLGKAQLANSTAINAFRFYGESSTANVATISLDNIRWYNTCILPPTHLSLVGVPTTGSVGTNLTSFTAEARSGSSSGPVANSFTGAITVAKVSGAGSISGTTAPNASAGVATYSNIQFSSADTYTIKASAAAPIVDAATSGNIVISSASPTISTSGSLSAVNTTYGSASATPTSFTVSGSSLNGTAAVTVTPPVGYEVATSSDFSTTIGTSASALSLGTATSISSTTIYVRLSATASVSGSPYSGNIVVAGGGATSQNVATVSSSVSKKALTITAGNQSVAYGTAVSTVTSNGSYTPTGFVNSETSSVIGGSASYTTTYTTTTAAGSNVATITPVTTNLTATNYSFTAASGNISVTAVVPTNYYLKSGGSITTLADWGTNAAGTTGGPAPALTTSNIIWNIGNNSVVSNSTVWTLGLGSKIIVGDGTNVCNFTIPASYAVTGTIDVSANATLTNTNISNPTLGTLAATSTVVFNAAAPQTIPVATYGNLTYSGTSTGTIGGSMTIGRDLSVTSGTLQINNATSYTLTIQRNLLMSGANSAKIDFNSGGSGISKIYLAGNLDISGTGNALVTNGAVLNGEIVFNGSNQSYSNTSSVYNGGVNFTISNGSTLSLLTSLNLYKSPNVLYQGTVTITSGGTLIASTFNIITGNGSSGGTAIVTVASGGTFSTSNTGGIEGIGSSGTNGTITTTEITRNYTAGANYIFNGVTTTAFPTTAQQASFGNPANITITANISLNRAITMSGILTLGGILTTTGTNTLTLTNTANTAISGGSTTAFINGPVIWTLGTTSSGTYMVPVGVSAAYYPMSFVAGTIASGSPTINVQAFATGVSSADGTTLSATSGNEYWKIITLGSTYVATSFSLGRSTPALGTLDAIGKSTTNGTLSYSYIGGTVGTLSGQPSINMSASGLSGASTLYLSFGKIAGPIITGTATATAFTTTYGTPSTAQSFAISGSALEANIIATAPTGFEVSSDGTIYGTTATFTQSGGTASGTLRIRLKADATVTGTSYNSANIQLTSTNATPVNITTASTGNSVATKALTITGISISNKVYDGNPTATISGSAIYSGLVSGENYSVTDSPTAVFANKTVANGKVVTVSGYTAPSSNYSITQPTGLTANITAATLTLTSASVTTKTYDGTTAAIITGSLSGVISSDVVTLNGTGTFASPDAGTGISVTSTSTLGGADAGNYTLTQPTGLIGNITKANQTITFNALANQTTATVVDYSPGATSATSGINAITYTSSNTGVATITAGGLIHIVGAGTTTITASQAASTNYYAAADVSQVLNVSSALLIEDFNYANAQVLTSNNWTAHSGTGSNTITTSTGTITYPGYLSSGIGNEVTLATSGEDINRAFTSVSSGSLYASVIVNITSATATGDYFAHFGATSGAAVTIFGGRIWVKKDNSGNLAFGISKSSTSANISYTGFNYSLSTTYLLVVKYNIITGLTNDTADLFINPTLNSLESTPSISTISADNSTTDPTPLISFCLRQGNVNNAAALKLDGIRVSTNWADIVGKITPTISISNSPQTYSGSAISATVNGSVAGSVSNVKYDGSSTAPTAPGTYAVTADFVPTDSTNYSSLTDASAGNFVINKATPTLSISNSPQTYSGSQIAATVTGSVAGTISNVKYGGSATVPTNAGTYAITANLVPTDGTNYNSLTDASAGNFVINKAASSVTVTGTAPFSYVYDGTSKTPSFTSAGSTATITYAYSSVPAGTYSSTTAPTNVGSYTVTASVAANANYEAASSSATAFGIVYPTNNWTGAISTSWSNPGNWSLNRVPLSTDNITISSGSPTLDVGHTIAVGSTLTLTSAGPFIINPNKILTIAGTADFGDKSVILKSDNTGDAAIGQVTGTLLNATSVTVERYILEGNRAWRLLTAPLVAYGSSNTTIFHNWQNNGVVSEGTGVELWGPGGTGANGSVVSATGLAYGPGGSIKQYGTGWSEITNTKTTDLFTTTANKAFGVFVTGHFGSGNISNGAATATTLRPTGQLIKGDVTFSVSSSAHTLIGNPYASPISPSSILQNAVANNIFQNLWVWDPKLSDFGAYVNFDSALNAYSYANSGTNGSGGSYSSGTAIQSGQAFFVRAVSGTSSLTLKESMKSGLVSNTFRNNNSLAASIFRASFLKQTATDWMPLDGCIAGFYEGANAAADEADGKKMINSGENIGFVRNAVNLSSEHYPLVTAQDILYLKVWNTQQAHYKLKLNTEEFTMTGVEAWLQDLYTGTSQQLNLDGSAQDYEFDVDPTVSASSGNRFRIVFTNTALAVTNPEQGQLSIYPNPATGGKVTVSLPTGNFEGCSYELINVLGQVVRQHQIENGTTSQVSIPITGLPNSWYALRIIKENSVLFQGKLIIKN
jgi:hypothetical protein